MQNIADINKKICDKTRKSGQGTIRSISLVGC